MHRRIFAVVFACFCISRLSLNAQDFKLFDRDVQIHGFASQGFVYTNTNNWLTMNTRQGSAGFTDFGFNVSTSVTDRLRVGAQLYDVVDYRFKSWFGVRGGKVKTSLGLYTDTQDLDFLRVFALLPQSVYPTDLRDATIAHLGGDIYGNVPLKNHLGDLSYTAFVGHRSDSIYSGNAYLVSAYQAYLSSYGGLQYGGDLRWKTPLKGLLIGASRMNEDITGKGGSINPRNPGAGFVPYSEVSKADWTNQFYGEYTLGKLRIDLENRRFLHDGIVNRGTLETITDVRGWYASGAYRVMKRLALGSYYSRYSVTNVSLGPNAAHVPDQTDTSLPANHIYDKVVTVRVDLKEFWDVKVEGHFMNGYGVSPFPEGFYPQVNSQAFKPNTNALVVKTGFHF